MLLAGCGILRDEVRWLARKNGWQIETRFLDSALHSHLDKLQKGVQGLVREAAHRPMLVFYGACHPLMDQMLRQGGAHRVDRQNCVEALLGHEVFERELAEGAYFLLEEWARRWEEITVATFGPNVAVTREIFRADRTYLLAIRTPCSGHFAAEAEAAARYVDLPLRWMDVGLECLEQALSDAMARSERRHGE